MQNITRRDAFKRGGAVLVVGPAVADTGLDPSKAQAATLSPSALWNEWQRLVLRANKAYWRANAALNHKSFVLQCDVPASGAKAKHARLEKAYENRCREEGRLTSRIYELPENSEANRVLLARVDRVYAEAARSFLGIGIPHHGRSLATALIRLKHKGELV